MTGIRLATAVGASWVGLLGLLSTGCVSEDPGPELLATAHQMGPVGYRDPAGAVSPDGAWLAYSQGREIVIESLSGGDRRSLGPAPSQVRYLTWMPDGRSLVVHERSFDRGTQDWVVYDVETGGRQRLWGGRSGSGVPGTDRLLELSWAPDGESVVGVVRNGTDTDVWSMVADGSGGARIASGGRLAYPTVSPTGAVACVEREGGVQRLRLPCDAGGVAWLDGHQPYGHVSFSADGAAVYYAAPDDRGVLELWARPVGGGPAERLATAGRDVYGPTVTRSGALVYKVQDYQVSLSAVPAEGGSSVRLTAFQSETPTWSPDGSRVSFTFGGWRIATDDVEYPDIDQHIGIVGVDGQLPRTSPDRVIRQSYSEDQGMHWSPNERWIVYHSHIDGTDDIYLVPADDPSTPRLISTDGHETGWPRWSPDGRWISFPTYTRDEAGARRSLIYVIPVDQTTGATLPQRVVELQDFPHDALQAEWTPDSERIVFEAAEGAGRKALYSVSRNGGVPERFHEWTSDQVHSGIAVAPDGAWVAYIGPGTDGFFQVHRVSLGGGIPQQMTRDPTQKTQPAYDPTGQWLAYTVFSYEARFWRLTAP